VRKPVLPKVGMGTAVWRLGGLNAAADRAPNPQFEGRPGAHGSKRCERDSNHSSAQKAIERPNRRRLLLREASEISDQGSVLTRRLDLVAVHPLG